jgi:hypothetical protein
VTTVKIADQLNRQGSQGAKVVQCVVCKGDIQPFAGRPVSLYGKRYAHHPDQCLDVAERDVKLREMAGQGELFAWQCRHVEPAGDMPVVCDELGTDRAAFERHMRAHGATQLAAYRPIRLRKTAPAAQLPKLEVNPFKWLHWYEERRGEWQVGLGNPLLGEADRKGQFWSPGPDPHSVWVVPLQPAPWEPKDRPAKPVCLYSHGDGRWSTDWSTAKRDRSEANRRSKRTAA